MAHPSSVWIHNTQSHLTESWKTQLETQQLAQKLAQEQTKQANAERVRRENESRIEKERLYHLREEARITQLDQQALGLVKTFNLGPIKVSTKSDIAKFILDQVSGVLIPDLCDIVAQYLEPETSQVYTWKADSQMLSDIKYGIWHYHTTCQYGTMMGNHGRRSCGHDRHNCRNVLAHVIHECPTLVDGELQQRSFVIVYKYKRESEGQITVGIVTGWVETYNHKVVEWGRYVTNLQNSQERTFTLPSGIYKTLFL